MQLQVITPQGTALEVEADEVTAPGARGEFGVLPGHTPFLTALRPGVLSIKAKGKGASGGATVYAIGAGYAEVSGPGAAHERVLVLTQHAAPAGEIDPAEAQRALEEADRALKEWKPDESGGTAGRDQLELQRAWAQARLDARAALRS